MKKQKLWKMAPGPWMSDWTLHWSHSKGEVMDGPVGCLRVEGPTGDAHRWHWGRGQSDSGVFRSGIKSVESKPISQETNSYTISLPSQPSHFASGNLASSSLCSKWQENVFHFQCSGSWNKIVSNSLRCCNISGRPKGSDFLCFNNLYRLCGLQNKAWLLFVIGKNTSYQPALEVRKTSFSGAWH